MIEDPDRCYQAAQSKDARFDGWFFCAVTSTGIYCRPSCPARTPKRENMRFYATAAAAQQAGFRACLRCRPDATPGSPEWNVRADVVARAMRLIRDGVVDREGVEGLAGRLGYSTRQLNRLITAEVGTGPLALARAQRSQTARVLLETTDLPVAHVAFAAGFASVRQCNDTVRQIFADTPSGLRARAPRARRRAGAPRRAPAHPGHPAPPALPAALQPGVGARLPRPARAARRRGARRRVLPAQPAPPPRARHRHAARARDRAATRGPATAARPTWRASSSSRTCATCTTAVARCRQLLDLDADPVAIWEALRGDPLLGPVVRARPGTPGARRRRRFRARRARRHRAAGLGPRGAHRRRAARAGGGRPAPRSPTAR